MIQSIAALISLVLALIVIVVALLVARRATAPDAAGYAAVYRVRRHYATALIAGLAIVLFLTLSRTPYASTADETPARKIEAVGWMWAWDFQVDGASASLPLEVPARELVEFAVTSKDVNHGFGISTRFGHLSGFAVRAGQQVHRGDVVGFVGSTGHATGPHLHYEILFNGQQINPLRLLARP